MTRAQFLIGLVVGFFSIKPLMKVLSTKKDKKDNYIIGVVDAYDADTGMITIYSDGVLYKYRQEDERKYREYYKRQQAKLARYYGL